MSVLSKPRFGLSTRMLLAGLAAATVTPVLAEEISFGEYQLFDFDTFAEETRYGWTSGDKLTTDLNLSTRIGGITGSRNKRITPAVKAWGVTIIPEVRADTRSGARLTSSLQATTGVVLDAGVTVGGEGFAANLQAGPTLYKPDTVTAGKFFQLQGGSDVGLASTFDPGLPRFDAGLDVVLNGSFDNKFEYGLFPIAKYKVGEFGFDFDLGFNLFDFDFDLNLPSLPSINFPDLPDFEIPASEDDNTLLRQKLPPSNPALSIAELAIDNPLKTIDTTTAITDDGRLTTSTTGSIMRAGLDIDGIATALTTGVSFTGTSVNIGPGKFSYDVIDVKYGVELGIDYKTEVDPFFNAKLSFLDSEGEATTVLVKNEDGTTSEVTSYEGRWDELPEIALLTREDVTVDVDFTDIEAMFSHSGALTLSDYMELQALKASVKVGKLKVAGFGPLYYQKFPLAGEFADFELFDTEFSLGSFGVGDFWDGSFVIETAPIIDVALVSATGSLTNASNWTVIEDGSTPTTLADKTLVIGGYEAGDMNRLDVTPIDFVDSGATASYRLTTQETFLNLIRESRSRNLTRPDADEVTQIDGLVVGQGSSYRLDDGGVRRFELNQIDNDGLIQADGFLELSAAINELVIEGDGQIEFNSPGEIDAQTLIHGEGHTINFNAFAASDLVEAGLEIEDWPDLNVSSSIGFSKQYLLNQQVVNPNSFSIETVATEHAFNVNQLDNAGTINFAGSDFSIVSPSFLNQTTGTVRVLGGQTLSLDDTGDFFDQFRNSGLLEANGAGSTLEINHTRIRGIVDDEGVAQQGSVIATDGGTVRFTSISLSINEQDIRAEGGTVTFDGLAQLSSQSTLYTDANGTINLDGGLDVKSLDDFDIINEGTLNVNSAVSLIPDINLPRDPNAPRPVIVPVGLTNTGVVNVTENGRFTFGAIINNFSNDGAVLAGGTWNLLGEIADHSNLTSSGTASIDLRILGYENEEDAFFDIFGGLGAFDTDLKTNAANVTLQGRAYFPYFNTVETNEGSLTITGGHQFTTATQYTNLGGTTTVQQGGDLFVQGALKVIGGTVDVDATSTLTALTQTEEIDDDGNTRDVTVEVIGGTLNIANSDYLAGTNMFFDRTDLMPEFNYIGLNAGQAWIVREQVLIDDNTEDETIIASAINLGNAAIERNNGTIIIDGANASFDAAERMRYNHGTLILQGGFEFNTLVNDFRNANDSEMILEGASFIVAGPDGTFRNDGSLTMDGDSYLFADQFINGGVNGPSATLQLDGVLDAQLVTINAGSTVTGSGMITGSIINNGTLDLGNSPGLIESFGSYTQGDQGFALFEIQGREAGTTYDQLIVRAVEAIEGEEEQPDLFVTLGGTLSLAFDENLQGQFGFEWLLIDNQGNSAIIGEFDPIDVTGLTAGDPLNTGGVDTTGDLYLGDLNELAIFLSYTGGDGNDLTVYAVPEPSSLMLFSLGGLALLRRRRRDLVK